MKYTESPWSYSKTGERMQSYEQPFAVFQTGKPNLIAGVFGDTLGGEITAEANAKLMAAAPDLLAVCQDILVEYPTLPWSTLDAIQQAIKKATA